MHMVMMADWALQEEALSVAPHQNEKQLIYLDLQCLYSTACINEGLQDWLDYYAWAKRCPATI